MDHEFVICVFVGCCALAMGFCWLCSGGFLLVMGVRFVGLVMLDGIVIGLAVGYGCHRQFGHGLWVSLLVWPWAMGRGCGVGFFCLGCWVATVVRCLATAVVWCLICGAGLAVLWVAIW